MGADSTEKLKNACVAVFGIGGVGGFAVEALARAGVGKLVLVDKDRVEESNINRQIVALPDTVGKVKVEVMKKRILDINPDCEVEAKECFFLPDTSSEFDFSKYDYVVDAVDTVTAKIELVLKAKESNTPIISCMGAGNKLDGTTFKVADIYNTEVCPLAKVMRRELKKRNVTDLKVVYSTETPVELKGAQNVTGSISFVPGIAGLIMAGEVIKDLCNIGKS